MKWIEPNIDSICTTGIIYYSDEYKETCKKICKVLKIDLFPDADQKSFWNLNDGIWEKENIKETQKAFLENKSFDIEVLNNLRLSNSNILFCYHKDFLAGIMHFTNYNDQLIYQSLYQNFYAFETNLREHLISLGYNYKDFENYYKYKASNEKSEKSKNYYNKQLEKIQKEKYIEAENLRPLQRFEFKELLSFSISSFHNSNKLKDIGLVLIKESEISLLRNTIMHSTDFVGASENTPFEYTTFEVFFKRVLEFKKAFLLLNNIRFNQAYKKKIKANERILKQIDDMKEDSEIKDFFYNRN